MISKTFALVHRALRVDVRTMRSHLFRAALAVVVLFALLSIQDNQFSMSAPGLMLFSTLSFLNYWFITLAGATFFASCITEEKEERTIGLLKMANIGPLAMLTGKWIPRLIGAALLLAIQIPFTVLSVTLGGVLWNQIIAAYVALLAHLFLVGNLGLLASVLFSRTGAACGFCIAVLFVYHAFPPVIQQIAQWSFALHAIPAWLHDPVDFICNFLMAMCGLWTISSTMTTGFNDPWFGFQFISNMIAGTLFFGLAWLFFEPCTRNDVEPAVESRWMRTFRLRGQKSAAPPRAWTHALIWKDFQYSAGGLSLLVVKTLAYGVIVFGFLFLAEGGQISRLDNEALGGISIGLSLFLICIETPLITTRIYRNEISQKTWSTLCLLPRSMPEIAYAKLAGGSMALIPALIWLSFGCLLCFDNVMQALGELLKHASAFFAVSYFCLQILITIFLATWLSVAAGWAIWPLAIFMSGFIVTMSNSMLIGCFVGIANSDEESAFAILILISIGIIAWLHVLIGKRLVAAAAE